MVTAHRPGTADGGAEETVFEIDLRSRYQDLVDAASVDDLQRAQAAELGLGWGRPGRILVIDRTESVGSHERGLARLLSSRSTRAVLCVLIGPPNGDPTMAGAADGDAAEVGAPGGASPGAARAGTMRGERPTGRRSEGVPGGPEAVGPAVADPGSVGRRPGRASRTGGRAGGPGAGGPAGAGPGAGSAWSSTAPSYASLFPAAGSEPTATAGRPFVSGDPGTAGSRPARGTGGRPRTPTPAPSGTRSGTSRDERVLPAPPPGTVLCKPPALAPPAAATLWISDTRGVGWSMSETRPVTVSVGADRYDDTPALGALLDALRQPLVFDRIFQSTAAMIEGTAVPGLWAVIGRIDESELAAAQVRAIGRLVPEPGDVDENVVPRDDLIVEPLPTLLGRATTRRRQRTVRPDGIIGASVRQSRDLLLGAEFMVAGLHRGRVVLASDPPVARIGADLARAAEELAVLRFNLAQEFREVDGRHGLDRAGQERVEALGIDLDQPVDVSPGAVVAALRSLVDKGLDRARADDPDDAGSLVDVTSGLRGLAAEMYPRGSADRLAELFERCPDRLLSRLGSPGHPELRLRSARPLGSAAGCAAAIGFGAADLRGRVPGLGGWFGSALAAVAAALAVLLVVAAGWLLTRAAQATRERTPLGGAAVLGLAAGAGAAGGWFGATPLAEQTWPLAVTVAAVLIGLLGLLVGPTLIWRSAVRRWRLAVGEGSRALDDIEALVEDVAQHEWVLARARYAAHELTQAVHGVTQTITDILRARAVDLEDYPTPSPTPIRSAPGGQGPGGQGPGSQGSRGQGSRGDLPGLSTEVAELLRARTGDIAGVMRGDLVELVRVSLERLWSDLEQDDLDAPSRWLADSIQTALVAYMGHVARYGIHEAPAPTAPREARSLLARTAWQGAADARAVLTVPPTDSRIIQLCEGEHLTHLAVTPRDAVLARFVPSSARAAVEPFALLDDPAQDDADGPVWTTGGQVAGVLRLAALRVGAVQTMPAEAR